MRCFSKLAASMRAQDAFGSDDTMSRGGPRRTPSHKRKRAARGGPSSY